MFAFSITHFPPHLASMFPVSKLIFFSSRFFQRTVIWGGLHPCVTNCFCGFSSFPSPHFFPSYKPILEGLLLLEQQSGHEWDLESGDEKELQKLAREPAWRQELMSLRWKLTWEKSWKELSLLKLENGICKYKQSMTLRVLAPPLHFRGCSVEIWVMWKFYTCWTFRRQSKVPLGGITRVYKSTNRLSGLEAILSQGSMWFLGDQRAERLHFWQPSRGRDLPLWCLFSSILLLTGDRTLKSKWLIKL